MSIQNSLDRIFAAMVEQLREVVAPNLTDPYAKSQALAIAEMLANLETRVEWRCDQLREEILEVWAALGESGPEVGPMSSPELVAERRRALAALAAAQAAAGDDPELSARVAALIARRLEVELGRLRTGMYR